MTITSTTARNDYIGDGVTTTYPYGFRIFSQTDLLLTKRLISTGVETTLTLTTDYSVTGVGSRTGGTIVLTTALLTTYALTVRRVPPNVQATNIRNQGTFFPETHEDAFDYVTMLVQSLADSVGRGFALPETIDPDSFNTTLPILPASGYVRINAAGTGLEAVTAVNDPGTYTQSGTGAISRTVTAKFGEWPSVKDVGAKGDGVTNDTAAFRQAAANWGAVFVPTGTYVISSVVDIQNNQDWYFDNVTLIHTDNTATILRADTKTNWSVLGHLVCQGTQASASTITGEVGLYIKDCARHCVEGYTGQNFRGYGLFLTGVAAYADRGSRGRFVNCAAYDNTVGAAIDPGSGSEYNTWVNFQSSGNYDGLYIGAGNQTFHGGSVVDNRRDGVVLESGANHGHGSITGMNINHNVRYNVYTQQVTLGFTFIGCHLYAYNNAGAGAIFLDRSKGIVFVGGHLDCWVYNDKDGSSGYNYIKDMYCPGSYGVFITEGPNPGKEQCVVQGCTGAGSYAQIGSLSINDPGVLYVRAQRDAAVTQALTSGVAADLTFNVESFDRRACWNGTTLTVPTGMAGQYRITGNLVFSAAAAVNPLASYVELLYNGAAVTLFPPSTFGTTKLVVPVSIDMYLNDGDAVKMRATITATTPVHGDPTYISVLQMTRIA